MESNYTCTDLNYVFVNHCTDCLLKHEENCKACPYSPKNWEEATADDNHTKHIRND